MPGPVNLDVRNSAAGPAPGYAQVTASNGNIYYYKYTGGDDGQGNATVSVGRGQAAIVVTLHSDSRYSITNVVFAPGDSQFSWHAGGSAAAVVINDTAVRVASVKYTCVVTDSTANCTISCDPMIHNVP